MDLGTLRTSERKTFTRAHLGAFFFFALAGFLLLASLGVGRQAPVLAEPLRAANSI